MTRTAIAFCTPKGVLDMKMLVPETNREQERGLQDFRISEREGMIFLSDRWPQEQTISMWQATVPYPLAMIWIGQDNLVKAMEFVEPGDKRTYSHRGVAVIEVNASVPVQYGIQRGTQILDGKV